MDHPPKPKHDDPNTTTVGRYHHAMPRKAAATPSDHDVPPSLDEAATRVLRQFRQIFNAVRTHFQSVEKKVGMGGAQVWALSVIQTRPDIGMGDLARAMDIRPSTASNLVKTLAERELVEVLRRGADKRAVQLRLLPAGLRVLKRSPGPFAGVLPQALDTLDPRTLKRLEADLGKILEGLKSDEKAGGIPLADL